MEWIIEGMSLIFVGALVASVTFIDPTSIISKAVFLPSFIGLFVLAVISLFTGFSDLHSLQTLSFYFRCICLADFG
jgi:hypothetical protein